MLFMAQMTVSIPRDIDPDALTRLLADEKAGALELQRAGVWLHLWRVVGQYSNVSVFDVSTGDELHDILWNLPLFPYMQVKVTALAQHPSDLAAQE